jgi:cytochrome c-type biogenesis protein CcmH/NrfG
VRTKSTIAILVVVLAFYAVLIGLKGVALLASGTLIGQALGVAVLVLPLLGLGLVWREIEFGRRTAGLARALDAEHGLPPDDLPRRPSGRVDREAADEFFARMRAEAEARPEDWRSWFRLALAYDAAGDRSRARAAARHALALHGRPARRTFGS